MTIQLPSSRARLAARLAAAALVPSASVAWLYLYDAPQWAYAVAIFALALPTRFDVASDTEAIRSTVRVQIAGLEKELAQLREALRLMYDKL